MSHVITRKNGDLGEVPGNPQRSGHGSGQDPDARNLAKDQIERLIKAASASDQSGLAEELGISPQAISGAKGDWEKKGKPLPLNWFVTISERFKVPLDWLRYGTRPARIVAGDESQAPADRAKEESKPSSLSERLIWLISREAKGDPVEFARFAGIPPVLMHPYTGGQTPSLQDLTKIRDAYGVNPEWLVSGKGDPYLSDIEKGVAHQGDYLYRLPGQEKDAAPARSPKVEELLALAAKVLTSDNRQAAEALEKNIRSLADALDMQKRLASVEERLKTIERKLED